LVLHFDQQEVPAAPKVDHALSRECTSVQE